MRRKHPDPLPAPEVQLPIRERASTALQVPVVPVASFVRAPGPTVPLRVVHHQPLLVQHQADDQPACRAGEFYPVCRGLYRSITTRLRTGSAVQATGFRRTSASDSPSARLAPPDTFKSR